MRVTVTNPFYSLVFTLGEFGNVSFIFLEIYMHALTSTSQPGSKPILAVDPGAALSKYVFAWLMSTVTDYRSRRRI
jgi:hypothetical protein